MNERWSHLSDLKRKNVSDPRIHIPTRLLQGFDCNSFIIAQLRSFGEGVGKKKLFFLSLARVIANQKQGAFQPPTSLPCKSVWS